MGCSKTYVHKVLKAKGIIKVDGVYTIPEGGFDSEDSH